MQRYLILRFAALSLAFATIPAHAAPTCEATGSVKAQNYPGAAKIPRSNNLTQPAGKAIAAEGQPLIIEGILLDAQCSPVAEAIVELWQNDPYGKWILAGPESLANPNPVFAGAGRTYTDNEGRFAFITVFPAPLAKRAPFVNIKVTGEGLPDFSSMLFFSDDVRNDSDAIYKKLSEKVRADTTIKMNERNGSVVGDIKIVLPSKAPYRAY